MKASLIFSLLQKILFYPSKIVCWIYLITFVKQDFKFPSRGWINLKDKNQKMMQINTSQYESKWYLSKEVNSFKLMNFLEVDLRGIL